ncbi:MULTISPECIES: F-box-like domain-containing protein [Legionella]|uniref:Ankyrin repeats (3 copies) n=1 Tax=Legionella drozanskii LLAP-1 TaxID=1212489 RepID=A0A0W0T0V7_9GAMM|nr:MULTISPECIES: F-box-like domain-containing protein [Legionella]KTC89239.1 Ankyrin repeats (3 copies) [Legionella drozanskii LLAP-1]PJE13389.1 MAG: hypothetical protein CK430_06435 [Legionella sp.]
MRGKTQNENQNHPLDLVQDQVDESNMSLMLSDEIWLAVLSFLYPKSLVNVELVSTRFRGLAKDNLLWKKLFLTVFLEGTSIPTHPDFDWKETFAIFCAEEYGSFDSQTRKRIFLIIAGSIDQIHAANLTVEDLSANSFLLIKIAARFTRLTVLDYFYLLGLQELKEDTPTIDLAAELEHDLYLLRWAVICNKRDVVHMSLMQCPSLLNMGTPDDSHGLIEIAPRDTITYFAVKAGHLDLLLELLNYSQNRALQTAWDLSYLYKSIVLEGQMSMLKGFGDFLERHRQAAPTNENSARIIKSARSLTDPLIIAAHHGHLPCFRKVYAQLRHELKQKQARILLSHVSSSVSDVSLLENDLEEAKKPFTENFEKAMLQAASAGQTAIIEYALTNQLIAIDQALGIEGSTVLYRAVGHHQVKLLQFLLANNADPDIAFSSIINSPAPKPSSIYWIEYQKTMALFLKVLKERKKEPNGTELLFLVLHDRADTIEQLFAIDHVATMRLLKPILLDKEVEIGPKCTELFDSMAIQSVLDRECTPAMPSAANFSRFFSSFHIAGAKPAPYQESIMDRKPM